ncbi:MAG: YebC/PmpR family DNA-binding transcriptional regulator [Vampirovibrionales bacterium]
MMMGRWMAIKQRKTSADAKKGVALARYSRELMRASKLGGADPSANFRLRKAIEQAKAGGLAKEAIEKAILKGSGQLAGDKALEDVVYEGYGPAGVALLIETATDNRNRTAGDIRSYFNKYEGNLGQDGCVAYLFEPQGVVEVPAPAHEEDRMMAAALEAGADDVAYDANADGLGVWRFITDYHNAFAVAESLSQTLPANEASQLKVVQHRVPATTVNITCADVAKPLLKLLNALEDHDDVETVYCNAEFSDALLQELG